MKPSDVAHIFRSYDVRGVVGRDLGDEIMERIGLAFGNYVKKDIVIAHDVRIPSPFLKDAFIEGFLKSGHSAEDCGFLSLGAGMFRAWQAGKEFAFVTASHLPAEWNGVKFFHSNGAGFMEKENYEIRDAFLSGSSEGHFAGAYESYPNAAVLAEYIKFLNSKIKLRKKLDVVLDCGNGCACILAPQLFRAAGCSVRAIFDKVDGTFPNRLPDPIEKELSVLKSEMPGSDLGIAYDGDADRTALVDDKGRFMMPEETSFIILLELLKKEKGPVVANVECTRIIDSIAAKFKRQVIRVPVGHTFLMEAVNKHSASFGVESAGHYAMPSIIPFDDSMVVGLYVAHVLAQREEKLSELRKEVPEMHFERLSYECPDKAKFEIMKGLMQRLSKDFPNVNKMDGVRVDLENGWCLIRVSNTSPYIRLTVEGNTEQDKKELQKQFLDYLRAEMRRFNLELVPEHK